MTAFQRKKKDILATLSAPDESYADLSPKGSVDLGIRALVDKINEHEELVTTSSCAGRVAIYVEGSKLTERTDEVAASSGGKGGGRWLFVSHDPVTYDELDDEGLMSALCLVSDATTGTRSITTSHVRFKFEPMILHILCSSILVARKVLGSALSAGFRESGISSINDDGDMVMVGIRTHGLAFDSVIGLAKDDDASVDMLVSVDYLRTLLKISRERFASNMARKSRFADALSKSLFEQSSSGKDADWEPADVRRARKRAEGLARREKLLGADDNPDREVDADTHDLPVETVFQSDN